MNTCLKVIAENTEARGGLHKPEKRRCLIIASIHGMLTKSQELFRVQNGRFKH